MKGIDTTIPPGLSLMWLPGGVAGKRRNRKPMAELVATMDRWKDEDQTQIDAINTCWIPIVRDGIMPRLPTEMVLTQGEYVAIRGMQGSVLATARRKSQTAPSDALADSVGALHHAATTQNTDAPLTNIFASWLFAVGYWVYHQQDVQLAVNQALSVLDGPSLAYALTALTAQPRFQRR